MDLASAPALGFAIRDTFINVGRDRVPDLYPFFPLRSGFRFDELRGNGMIVLRIQDEDSQIPAIGSFDSDPGRHATAEAVLAASQSPDVLVGPEWRGPLVFSYFGPAPTGEATNWPPLWNAIQEWANELVLPRVEELNRQRILRAVPEPPQWDPTLIDSTLVIDDGAAHQGTGFLLEGVGIVTCSHVLTDQSMVFRTSELTRRVPARIIARNAVVDLAILAADGISGKYLRRGSAADVPNLSQVMALGYPNYQLGDSGVLMPGLIVGRRPRSGIQRMLTNARIVGGMSGGPVVGPMNSVIGVCVTGADRSESAEDTEDHGVVPIDAVDLLSPG